MVARRLFCTLLAGILIQISGVGRAEEPRLTDLDSYVETAMRIWQTPGLSLAIVKDGRVILAKGYGLRRLGGTEPVDENTVFAAASITKTFTAAAVATLVANGKMRWDDRVIDHLPAFRLHDSYATHDMRLRDLLSHRSGLHRGDMIWYYSNFDRAEVLRRSRHLEMKSPLRARFGYQNIMFTAAGEAVGDAAGTTWDAYIKDQFFTPLGMSNSSTSIKDLPRNAATPHASRNGAYRPIDWLQVDNIGAAGSINSSAADLAKWIKLQLDGGKRGDTTILRTKDIAEMRRAHTVINVSKTRREYIPQSNLRAYGLGWYMADYRGKKVLYHGGRLDGMSAHLALLPDLNLGMVALSNRGRSSLPAALMYRIFDAYLDAPPTDWSSEFLAWNSVYQAKRKKRRAKVLDKHKFGTRPSMPLAGYVGFYDSQVYGPLDIWPSGDKLLVTRNNRVIGDLTHWHYDTFIANFRTRVLRDRLITFRIGKTGTVDAFDIEFSGEFTRSDPPQTPDLRKPMTADKTSFVGTWMGRWDNKQPHTLIVESIEGKTAKSTYAWAPSDALKVSKEGSTPIDGTVTDGTLTLSPFDDVTVSYTRRNDATLDATYKDGSGERRATLRRIR